MLWRCDYLRDERGERDSDKGRKGRRIARMRRRLGYEESGEREDWRRRGTEERGKITSHLTLSIRCLSISSSFFLPTSLFRVKDAV